MALSEQNKKILRIAMGDKTAADAVAAAIDSSGSGPAAAVVFSAGANLVGVNGTGSNAAPLAGTETRLDSLDTAVAAIIANMQAVGLMS